MDRAPIPPHERSWRHPSELVATATEVDTTTGSPGRRIAVATGAVAATFAVVLAITLLPDRTPAPVAMSATTLPPFSVSVTGSVAATSDEPEPIAPEAQFIADQVRLERPALAASSGVVLTGSPRSVAAPFAATEDDRHDPDPHDGAIVHLVTTSHVYRLTWADLDRVLAPDGTLVIDDGGRVVGSFVDGGFVAD